MNNESANISDFSNYKLSTARIGGLIGTGNEMTIQNCFVRDLYVNIKVNNSGGIGGIIGYISGGDIDNCYAIGQIKTNASNLGGIIGNGVYKTTNNAFLPNVCENCYSLVNIKTDGTTLGGIVGYMDTSSLSRIINNISLGNLYTSVVGTNISLNRIIGSNSSTTYDNYGYKDQLINGFKDNANKGAKYIVEKNQLIENYNNMFKNEIFYVSDLENEYLPRLKYRNSDDILPNQETMKKFPENPTLEIISAKESDGKIKLQIKDENTVPVDTNTIGIQIANFKDTTIQDRSFNSTTKIHTLYVIGNPIYFLDSYEINQISYTDSVGEKYKAEVTVKISYTQYKTIESIEEWAAEFCPAYSGYNYHKVENDGKPEFLSSQNYKLMCDINLTAITTLNGENLSIPINLEIGRLVGDSSLSKIYNASLTFRGANSGIFKTIARELKNISFEDISITNTSGSYTGIIAKCTAQEMKNLKFTNINIQSSSSYIGMISYNTCVIIQNIELTNINCRGTSSAYVGGLFGFSYPGKFSNITGTNITVNGTSSYIGGLFGYVSNRTANTNGITNISISNVYVHSNSGSYIGGIFGMNYARNGTRYNVKDLTINCNNCSYIGGITGYLYSGISNAYIYGINIKTNGSSYVGGLSGYGAGITNGYIEGYIKDDNTAYNVINAKNASNVGIIAGYCWETLNKSFAKNIEITGNSKVGGILGWGITCAVYNAISQDCSVTGNTYVGGIMGALTPDSYVRKNVLYLYNTYNNNVIKANTKSAGGILGYLNNSKMNNSTYQSRIYRNYVACSEITTPLNAGGFIGEITNPLYYLNNNTKYYYSNLIVSNIDENYPIGNIDSIKETYTVINTVIDEETGEEITKEEKVTRTVPPEETMSRLFNSLFYEYKVENEEKTLVKEKLDTLKLQTTYTGTLLFGANNTYYNYSNISTMFPTLSTLPNYTASFTDGTSKTFEQTGINLPVEGSGLLTLGTRKATAMRMSAIEQLPIYNVYTSDVDKINLEFDNIYPNAYFRYKMSDGEMSDKIVIEKRTYTFQYDFSNDFYFILGNNSSEEEFTISPLSISKKISIVNGQYSYIQNKKIYGNIQIDDSYKFVNLWNDKALTDDGYIYSISQNAKISKNIEGLVLLEDSTPLNKFIYESNIVETYYHYTKIINEDQSISNYQMFMKNGNIFVLDGNLKIYGDAIIIDSYNNREYETALGLDGIIYNFKDEINYPEGFENSNIAQMTNNIEKNDNLIGILYSDGRIYIFNYISGNVIFDSANKSINNTVLTKIKSLFNINKTEMLYDINEENYEQALELQEKLTETPIEELEISSNGITEVNDNILIIEKTDVNTTSNSTTDRASLKNEYTTVYDSTSNSYLVYKTSNLLNAKNNISETEKIMLSPELTEYYQTEAIYNKSVELNGIYFIAISIVSIVIILMIMYKKKNY